jgi:hypothetical protein
MDGTVVGCGYSQSIIVGVRYLKAEKLSKLEKYRVSYIISLNLSARHVMVVGFMLIDGRNTISLCLWASVLCEVI